MTIKEFLEIVHKCKLGRKVIQRDHFGDIVELDKYNFYIEPETGHLRFQPEDIGPDPE